MYGGKCGGVDGCIRANAGCFPWKTTLSAVIGTHVEGYEQFQRLGYVVNFLKGTILRARGMLITASLVEHGRGRGEVYTLALLAV